MTPTASSRVLRPVPLLALVLLALGAIGLSHALHVRTVDYQLSNAYTIEVTHGASTTRHSATLATQQALDIDGDGVSDVFVRAGHANVNSVFGDGTGNITAPVFTVSRHPSAVAADTPAPAARIVLRFAVSVDGLPGISVGFGYDTRLPGGTIPRHFSAVLGGLDTGFQTLRVVADTSAPYSVTSATAAATAAASGGVGRATYEGPLTLVTGFRNGDALTDLNLQYQPLPPRIDVEYVPAASSAQQATVVYSHSRNRSLAAQDGVDVRTYVASCEASDPGVRTCADPAAGPKSLELRGAIDRLPSSMRVKYRTESQTGRYSSGDAELTIPAPERPALGNAVDGRAPDVRLDAVTRDDGDVSRLKVALEALPGQLAANWYVPDKNGCQQLQDRADRCALDLELTASGDGVGGVDASIATFDGASPFPEYVPDREQFLDVRSRTLGDSGPSLLAARVRSLRSLSITEHLLTGEETKTAGFHVETDLGDGVSDLAYHFASDQTGALVPGGRIEARGVVSPLPETVTLDLRDDPSLTPSLTARYTASSPVTATTRLVSRELGSGPTAACGDPGVTCVDGRLEHLPADLTVSYDDTVADGVTTRVEAAVDADRGTGDPKPAVSALITSRSLTAPRPSVLRVDVDDLPDALRARVDATPVTGDLQRLRLFTCPVVHAHAATTCAPGSSTSPLGMAKIDVRNHVERPVGFPLDRPAPAPFVRFVARPGADGEDDSALSAQIAGLESVDYWATDDVTGLKAAITHPTVDGAVRDLRLDIDSAGIDDPTDAPDVGAVDTAAAVRLTTPPREVELCLRAADRAVAAAAGPAFTAACEVEQPFSPHQTLTRTPMSLHYKTDATFGVEAQLLRRTAFGPGVADDERTRARLSVASVPRELTVHLLTPPRPDPAVTDPPPTPPLRLRYTLPQATTVAPTSITFAAEDTVGDARCRDSRPGRTATCISGSLAGLPQAVDVVFSGEQRVPTSCQTAPQNLCVQARSASDPSGTLIVRDLDFSDVRPDPTDPTRSSVVAVNTARRSGSPYELKLAVPGTLYGTLELPSAHHPSRELAIDVAAEPALPELDLDVRTFVGADPLPPTPPGRAPEVGRVPDVLAIQRGSAMKARLHVTGLRRLQFAPVASDEPAAPYLPTKAISLDFSGEPITTRIYADLQPDPPGGEQDAGLAPDHVLADIHLAELPTGVDICLRGARPDSDTRSPAAGSGTWCDDSDGVRQDDDAEGAFQFVSSTGATFDVDALFRLVTAGGQQLVNGRLAVTGVPGVVRGTFPTGGDEGALDIGGFARPDLGTTPDALTRPGSGHLSPRPIGALDGELATFDHDGTGYEDAPPYERRVEGVRIDGQRPAGQHLELRLGDGSVHTRLRLGGPATGLTGGATTARSLQRLQLERPQDATGCRQVSPDGVVPADFPALPTLTGTDRYLCLRTSFDDPATASTAPVALSVRDDVHDLSLTDAGLTTMPRWFSIVLASVAETAGSDGSFLPRCSATQGAPCAPPLLRLDQPDAQAKVFGTLTAGPQDRVAAVAALDRPDAVQLPALAASGRPGNFLGSGNADGWSDWGAGASGIRATVALAPQDGPPTAVRAVLRLPVPRSLTVDQVQSWDTKVGVDSSEQVVQAQSEVFSATHLRLHYRVTDGTSTVASLGQLAALVGTGAGDQLALTGTDEAAVTGVTVPGELDLDVHLRDDKKLKKMLVAADVRVPTAIDARVHVLPSTTAAPELVPVPLDATLLNLPGSRTTDEPNDPSFRLRFAVVGNQPFNETGAPCRKDVCTETGSWPDGSPLTGASLAARFTADLDPTKNDAVPFPTTRLLEGVLRIGVTSNGLELMGFQNARPPAASPNPTTLFGVHGELAIAPFNLSTLRPGETPRQSVGAVQVVLRSALTATFDAPRTRQLAVRQNLAHVDVRNATQTAASGLPADTAGVSPVTVSASWHVDALGFVAYGTDNPRVAIRFLLAGGVFAGAPGTLDLAWRRCPASAPDPSGTVPSFTAARNAAFDGIVWPFNDGDLLYTTTVAPIIANGAIRAAWVDTMCEKAPTAWMPLLHEDATGTAARTQDPGDPLAGRPEVAAHPVPDARDAGQPAGAEQAGAGIGTPDYTVTEQGGADKLLCGVHRFATLDVYTDIRVATTAIGTDSTGTGPDCPAGQEGRLHLLAGEIHLYGDIDGSALNTATNATGNGGGGNGAAGGDGSHGSGGARIPFDQTNPPRGAAGGQGGSGGGVIVVEAGKLWMSGTITVRGGDGPTRSSGACATKDSGNTGSTGGGGGAGGSLVIRASEIVGGGRLIASGGRGGGGKRGGGGGGAGGSVVLEAPIYDLPDRPFVGGRAGGGNGGCPESVAGKPGSGGYLSFGNWPASVLEGQNQAWYPSLDGVQVGFSAAAQGPYDENGNQTVNEFDVVLCGRYVDELADPMSEDISWDTQFGNEARPCGVGLQLDAEHLSGPQGGLGDRVVYSPTVRTPEFTIASQRQSGYLQLWSIAVKADVPGVDCANVSPQTYQSACRLHEIGPQQAVKVLGIDGNAPEIGTMTGPTVTADPARRLTFSIDAQDPTVGQGLRQSGIARIACSIDGDPRGDLGCRNGTSTITLPGEGAHTLRLRAYDGAGNASGELVRTVRSDTAAPTASSGISPAAPASGWYSAPPVLTLQADDAGGSGVVGFRYRWNSGAEVACSGTTCSAAVPQALSAGRHRVYYTAVDAAGNTAPLPAFDTAADSCLPASCRELAYDGTAPAAVVAVVPDRVNANGYHADHPLVALSAVDQPGGSGAGALRWGTSSGAATTPYTGSFPLPAGATRICAVGSDVAGNTSPETCRDVGEPVDLAAPSVAVSFGAALPTAGWYRQVLTVAMSATDADGSTPGGFDGSTIEARAAAVEACAAEALFPAAPVPAGVCFSVDGAGFQPLFTGAAPPALTAAGPHVVRAVAIDPSGRRSEVREVTADIDLDDPVVVSRTIVGAPQAGGAHRLPVRVVAYVEDGHASSGAGLLAHDSAASLLTYDSGTGPVSYDGSFPVPDGGATVTLAATDPAGRVAAVTRQVDVDGTAPVVTAGSASGTLPPYLLPYTSDVATNAVMVYDKDGLAVARLPGSNGAASWNGRYQVQLGTGSAVDPPATGCFTFAAVGADPVGNVGQSRDSARFGACLPVVDNDLRPPLVGTWTFPTTPTTVSVLDSRIGAVL